MDSFGLAEPQANALIPHDSVIDRIPGSLPLRNPRHERYARHRSLLMPRLEAARMAGYEDMTAGNAAKLDRKAAISERIAFLCRQDEDILKAKRLKLEEFLWNIHEVNYADFWETVEEDEIGDDDEPTGKTIRYQKLKPFSELALEHQRVIQSLKYTEKGRPVLEVYSKLQANQELRKLLGIGGQEREGLDEVSQMSTPQLINELREMGVDVKLTLEWKGAE